MQVSLKVLNGSSAGRELKVPYDVFVIGRSEECHLRPKSDSISRRHCVLRSQDDKLLVEDLGSKNGTFVNGERVAGERELAAGDELRVGKLEFEVMIELPEVGPDEATVAAEVGSEGSWAGDEDITRWLEDGTAAGKHRDSDTRQLRLDETQRGPVDPAATASPETAEVTDTGKSTKPEKKAPGKLPARNVASSTNSREAAANMLKKFFNRP